GIRTCMASPVDMHTGRYSGVNCHGKEKVRRYNEFFKDIQINRFYSDSYSDSPLAEIAEEAFLVKGDRLLPWGRESR
nr:haloacid dehalogenase-like hydrolase [Solobacterium sp.]